jgi:tight adherence protein B
VSVDGLSPDALKWLACLTLSLATFILVFGVASDQHSVPYRYSALYVAYLERRLRSMFILVPGRSIAVGQAIAVAVLLGLGLALRNPTGYALVPIAIVGPPLYVERLKRRRIKAVEAKLDGFILALANALKATPSLGNALEYTHPLLPPPLDDEVGLTLKELRVGTTLEQALLNMSARIQSPQLDATLAGLLIGRQVGGELPKILETTAGTLREMIRLEGVLRSKTAEGKVQLLVVAVFPAVLIAAFDALNPGFFNPLVEQASGFMIIGLCVVLWVVALLLARKVLSVNL